MFVVQMDACLNISRLVTYVFKIYTFYNETNHLEDILNSYADSDPDNLKAQKCLIDFQVKHRNNLNMNIFQVSSQFEQSFDVET